MDTIFFLPGFLLIVFPLVGILVLTRHINRRMATRKAPVGEKMLRPAGESIREELEDQFERLVYCMFKLIILPVFSALFLMIQQGSPAWVKLLVFVVGIASVVWGLISFRAIIRKAYNYRLGFRGERFVGGLLETLREHGYRVFHDLPFDNFNIDHALVGPGGVFAIETKTRRKVVAQKGNKGKPAKVIFDGHALNFPEWKDSYGVQQACNNARHLATHLSAATGEKVAVDPVLVLPGWWVESTTQQPLIVLNPKQLISILPRRPVKLGSAQIQRIAYQLERMAEMEF